MQILPFSLGMKKPQQARQESDEVRKKSRFLKEVSVDELEWFDVFVMWTKLSTNLEEVF